MAAQSTKKEIPVVSLGDNFGEVIVKANGGAVHIDADGKATAVPAVRPVYKIGDLTEEGVYIGRFKNENGKQRDYFADVDDARDSEGKRLSLSFGEAAAYANRSRSLDRNDWFVPTARYNNNPGDVPDILNTLFKLKDLFNNRADGVRGFADKNDKGGDNWYWSCMSYNHGLYPIAKLFRSGHTNPLNKDLKLSVRLVRSIAV